MKKLVFILLPIFAFMLLACDGGGGTAQKTEEEIRREIESELRLEEQQKVEIDKCATFSLEAAKKLNELKEQENNQDFSFWLSLNKDCWVEEFGEESFKETMIVVCENLAFEEYAKNWISYCEVNNIRFYDDDDFYKGRNCNIPAHQADEFERQLQTAKDRCVARYR